MPDAHDPAALVRHAAQVGDWLLVELIARLLRGDPSLRSSGGRRTYRALVLKLGLAGDLGDYDRR
jgi:hypothetical protein